MAGARLRGADCRQRRRWSFAGCVFDEANWSLIVGGRRVAIETKPLELLRELLLGAGNLVSKEELLDAIWPDVVVVEASLPTAVRKLRCALQDDERESHIIEMVPRLGYRLAVPVEVEDLSVAPIASISVARPAANTTTATDRTATGIGRQISLAGLAIAVGSVALAIALYQSAPPTAAQTLTQRDAATALRKLDLVTIEAMLNAGWNPNRPFDNNDNGALNILLNNCEWDPAHDQRAMLLIARTLIDGGARLDHRNIWGDTPYSIAKAKRYCGPDHPVTNMIRTLCYAGYKPPGDRCLASYEIARRGG